MRKVLIEKTKIILKTKSRADQIKPLTKKVDIIETRHDNQK